MQEFPLVLLRGQQRRQLASKGMMPSKTPCPEGAKNALLSD